MVEGVFVRIGRVKLREDQGGSPQVPAVYLSDRNQSLKNTLRYLLVCATLSTLFSFIGAQLMEAITMSTSVHTKTMPGIFSRTSRFAKQT